MLHRRYWGAIPFLQLAGAASAQLIDFNGDSLVDCADANILSTAVITG